MATTDDCIYSQYFSGLLPGVPDYGPSDQPAAMHIHRQHDQVHACRHVATEIVSTTAWILQFLTMATHRTLPASKRNA
ncbi:MAG: hypothetical protein ACI8P0_003153 [Planctomycetaceae bacterium]|jgi:hypothetical protein